MLAQSIAVDHLLCHSSDPRTSCFMRCTVPSRIPVSRCDIQSSGCRKAAALVGFSVASRGSDCSGDHWESVLILALGRSWAVAGGRSVARGRQRNRGDSLLHHEVGRHQRRRWRKR